MRRLLLLEDHRNRGHDHGEPGDVIPSHRLFEVEDREHRKNRQGDNLLNRFQLRRAELVGADPIRRDLEAIFEEGDPPADHDHFEQWHLTKLQVSVPRKMS